MPLHMPFSEHREAPARLYCSFSDLELETLLFIERCYSRSKVSRQNPAESQMDVKDVANYNVQFIIIISNFTSPLRNPSRGTVFSQGYSSELHGKLFRLTQILNLPFILLEILVHSSGVNPGISLYILIPM